jgi:hypothetical protein
MKKDLTASRVFSAMAGKIIFQLVGDTLISSSSFRLAER